MSISLQRAAFLAARLGRAVPPACIGDARQKGRVRRWDAPRHWRDL